MKKMKIFVFFMCFFSIFCFAGCNQELPPAKITRDDARTGGSLSFVYDSNNRTIFVGGQDEVVQFSSRDEERNLSEGCRVGLKVTAPDEQLDLSSATLEMNGVTYSSGEFLESVNGQKQRFFNLYPIVSKDDNETKFSVIWQEGACEQEYKLVVLPGTKFMIKNGELQ